MRALTEVEQALVDAAAAGRSLRCTPGQELRAEVLRDVLLRGGGAPRGTRVEGARILGRLDLEGAVLDRPVRLLGCELTGPLQLRGGRLPLLDLRRSTLTGLSAGELEVDRVLLLSRVTVADGRIDLSSARIGAAVSLAGATVRSGTGPAVVLDRLRLAGELLLDGLDVTGAGPDGALRLLGARVDSRLSARGLRATNPSGPALVADNMQVTDTADFSHGSVLRGHGDRGAVRMAGAHATSLSFGASRVENPAGVALAAHYVQVAGTVYVDHCQVLGCVRLSGGRIGGQVDLTGSVVDGGAEPALRATRLQVGQAVVLTDARLSSAGGRATVDLRSARVAGDLELDGTRLDHPAGTALRLNATTVDGRVLLDRADVASGGLDLRDATVGTLQDDPVRFTGPVDADGLVYRGLLRGTVRDRLAWLGRMPEYAAQPYRQLAAAYQAAGHEDDARRVLVAQQQRLTGSLRGWSRVRQRLSGFFLQYGYQPLRAVGVLAAVLFVSVVLFLLLAGGTRTEAGAHCPGVDRVGLAIDAAVPLASTGADDRCKLASTTGSGQALAAAGWGLTLAGWASATLVVAGYTGLVRRR